MKRAAKAYVWRAFSGWSFAGYVRRTDGPTQNFHGHRDTHAEALTEALIAVGLATPEEHREAP